ncbi:hypothetical protein GA0115259_100122 [Streptomyces sp. MnatMP-M17]|nr:hypothetical protein GA0115259_100122 [Streptomyces sp. MnatMP-M17]
MTTDGTLVAAGCPKEPVVPIIRDLQRAMSRAYRRKVDLSHPARSPLGSTVVNPWKRPPSSFPRARPPYCTP